MDLKTFWAFAIAWVIPLVCGWLTKATLKSKYKFMITLGLSALLGTGTMLINVYVSGGSWDWLDAALYLGIVGEAEIVYRLFVKNIPGATAWLARTGPSLL
jgi:hypothetical protein